MIELVDIYPYNKFLYVCTSEKEVNQACKLSEINSKVKEKTCNGICIQGKFGYVIGVFDGSIETLGHEIGHLMIFLFEDIKTSINTETSEPFCYLQGKLMQKCYDLIFKKEENESKSDTKI